MVQIKVFGTTPPCANCKRAEAQAQQAAAQFPGQVQVIKLDAMGPEADAYGIVSTPLIVVDGEVVGRGKVISANQLADIIRGKLGG
ncbi:MAG: thioredoxin family protein [Anaerolineae bacterium]|nr:thioredoxin family protein [Anaerolineae bacterium]